MVKEVTFCLAEVNIIADVSLIFINNILIHINRGLILKTKSITNIFQWLLKRKALRILFDDWNKTFDFIFLRHVLNISINCFLLCREILRKNSKQIKISFLYEMVLEDLQVMNSWSKNILIQLSIKRVETNFTFEINFHIFLAQERK